MNEKWKKLVDPNELIIDPIEKAYTLPSAWYSEAEYLEFEQASIFSKNWQLVCHSSQLSNAGDSICRAVSGNPILIVRTNEMEVRAYYNVCRHRGGPLSVKKGTTSVLQCQYHGWTYLMDGSLRGVPQFDRVELFDKKDFGLKPVACEEWNGLIFVCLDNDPIDLNGILNGISDRIDPIRIDTMQYYTTTVDTIECNWKVYVDNYLEGYHIPIVHPELAGLLDYKNYVTEIEDHYSLQFSPFSDKSDNNPYHAEDGRAYYYFIYPNIMLNILPGRLQTNIVLPVDQKRCKVVFDFYYTNIEKSMERGTIESDLKTSADIQKEDIEICEAVQKGLQSAAYDKGRFSVERELGVWHFQSLVKKSFSAYLDDQQNNK